MPSKKPKSKGNANNKKASTSNPRKRKASTVVSGKKKRVKRNGSAPFQTLKKSTFYGRGNHIKDNVTFVRGGSETLQNRIRRLNRSHHVRNSNAKRKRNLHLKM